MSLEARVRRTGLLAEGRPVVVMLSGGRDSVCLLDLAVAISGRVGALHVNYGLRAAAAADDEAHCRALCEALGVPLDVHAPVPPPGPGGNLQAWARDERYAVARRLACKIGADIAAGHTATDQVETVLYRLAASPGRRALLGMRGREGRVVRPLLGVTRAETAAHCAARGLRWREDASNEDPAFARNRVRAALVPALRGVHPAAEANVLRTLELLRDEAAALDAVVRDALGAAGRGRHGGVPASALAALPPALRRLAFQRLADDAAGAGQAAAGAPAVAARVDEVIAMAAAGGTRALDLGGALRAVVTYGDVRVERRASPPEPPAGAVRLPVPGRVAFAGGEVTCELGAARPVGDGVLDAAACGGPLEVRPWRPGDRMRPLGLDGSRTLQDLFTDRKVPRADRPRRPVIVCGGEIAWVPGVATGDRFKVTADTREQLCLRWHG